jgi:hypothetical protein
MDIGSIILAEEYPSDSVFCDLVKLSKLEELVVEIDEKKFKALRGSKQPIDKPQPKAVAPIGASKIVFEKADAFNTADDED